MDGGGTFATGLAVGLFLGSIGEAFTVCMFMSAGESRQYRPTWPDVSDKPEPEPEQVLRAVPGSSENRLHGKRRRR